MASREVSLRTMEKGKHIPFLFFSIVYNFQVSFPLFILQEKTILLKFLPYRFLGYMTLVHDPWLQGMHVTMASDWLPPPLPERRNCYIGGITTNIGLGSWLGRALDL